MALDRKMTVLIVEDNALTVRIIKSLLKKVGLETVEQAATSDEALNLMQSKKYGLVLCDWGIQPTNGLDVLRQIRMDEKLRTLPFIMMTAEINSDYPYYARNAGVSNFMIKPFDLETLRNKLIGIFETI